MSLLEGIGLCSSFILLFWTVIGIVSSILALVALDLPQILPGFTNWTRVPIVGVVGSMSIPLVPRMISTESTIVVVAVGSVAASFMVIVPSVMTVSSVMMVVVMTGMLLERGLKMVLIDFKPPLPVFNLL